MTKNLEKKIKKVLIFGTFDGIHDGHRYFLHEAKRCGDELIVVVARDNIVKKLKGRLPDVPLPNRMEALKKENIADKIVVGDEEINTWNVLQNEKPDVVCVGYDQEKMLGAIKNELAKFDWKIEIVTIKDFQGDRLHSRFLKN